MTAQGTDLIREFEKLYTPAVSDAIDLLGIRSGCMSSEIRAMWPGARLCGFAHTVEMVPLTPDEPLREEEIVRFLNMAEGIHPGTIPVVGMSGLSVCAGWGHVTTTLTRSLGCVGTVVDGPVRDLARVIDMKYPVFARGTMPASIRTRMRMGAIDAPLTCGGVEVHPGDLIFGDINGVVVVPGGESQRVLAAAREIISTDEWWLEQLVKGRKPADIEKERPLP